MPLYSLLRYQLASRLRTWVTGSPQKTKMRRAARIGLRRGEFHVGSQPVVDPQTRHCMGVEALLRWRHPTFGAGGPGLFVRELEGTPLLGA